MITAELALPHGGTMEPFESCAKRIISGLDWPEVVDMQNKPEAIYRFDSEMGTTLYG